MSSTSVRSSTQGHRHQKQCHRSPCWWCHENCYTMLRLLVSNSIHCAHLFPSLLSRCVHMRICRQDESKVAYTKSISNICPWLHDHSMTLRKGVCPGHHSLRHCHPSSPCHPSSCKVHRYMHDLVRNISWFAQRLSRCHPSPLASQPHPRCSQRKS